MHADLRGFYGAPVTYATSVATGAASVASIFFEYGRWFVLDRDLVLRRGQWWRLVSSQLAFHHGLAAALGLYVIFQFRVLERQMGSRKFGSLLFFVGFVVSVLQLSALLSWPGLARQLAAGPYGVLGALVVYYMKFVPRLQPKSFSLFGLHFSEKSTTYILLLVVLARNPRRLLTFLPGIVLGILFSSTPLGELRLPSFVLTILSILHPLFDVVPPSALAQQRQRRILEAQRRLGMNGIRGRGQGFQDQLLPGQGGGMLPPRMAATPPSDEAIQQLVSLGFSRERAIVALQANNNNVEAAANYLLGGH